MENTVMKKNFTKILCIFLVCLQLVFATSIVTYAYESKCEIGYESVSPRDIHGGNGGDN